jgi:UMF1 family MFS transporter
MLPPLYRSMAKAAGASDSAATAWWAYTASIALLIIAILGPVLGAISDYTGRKKLYVGFFAAMGILGTGMLVFLGEDTYLLGSALFIVANIGFAGGNIFYESLLPHIAREGDLDRISVRGYALGYLGGGTLLVVNMLWFLHPEWFGMPGRLFAVKASFLSVAIWWALFSIPLFRGVSEPRPPARGPGAPNPVLAGLARLRRTWREIGRYKQLLLFLVAFWLYNDGIGTIIKMATAYGDEINIGPGDMILALVIGQFVGVPASFAMGRLAGRLGTKRTILAGLGVYTVISAGGFFMTNATHFYILAVAVSLVQGGTQALSRSFFAAMVPKDRASEFFGFMSTTSKFAGIVGPVVFGIVSQTVGTSRLGIVSLIIFFVGGGVLLAFVNEEAAPTGAASNG